MARTLAWSRLRQSWTRFRSGDTAAALRTTLRPLIWLPTGIVFTSYFYTVKQVSGRSMQPTLNPDSSHMRDVVIFDRLSVKMLREYKRGDIVALNSPTTPGELLVKRIVALEGDTVKTLPPYPDAEVKVPEGHVWVEGDERFHSADSNIFGPIPCALLDSRLSFIVLPYSRMGAITLPKTPDPRAPRTHVWKREMAAIEQEAWRRSRVTIAGTSTS